MSLDKDIALVDVNEVKQYLQLDMDNVDTDQYIETLINEASQFIITYCDRKFITPSADYDEIFDGDGEKDHYCRHYPLTAAISAIYYWDGDSWEERTAVKFTSDIDSGRVYYTDGNVFWKGKDEWKISYKYGWTLSNIPADLKYACCKLIALDKKQFEQGLHGIASKSFIDHSVSYNFDNLPKRAMLILNYYKRKV